MPPARPEIPIVQSCHLRWIASKTPLQVDTFVCISQICNTMQWPVWMFVGHRCLPICSLKQCSLPCSELHLSSTFTCLCTPALEAALRSKFFAWAIWWPYAIHFANCSISLPRPHVWKSVGNDFAHTDKIQVSDQLGT